MPVRLSQLSQGVMQILGSHKVRQRLYFPASVVLQLNNPREWTLVGSVSFLGEMEIGNPNAAAYITPDPITAGSQ